MKLAYKYSSLDKRHEYQIENSQTVLNQWVWFYLGKKLKLHKREILLPYFYEPTKIIGKYAENSAEKTAKNIVKAIRLHRSIRSIK